MDWRRQWGPDRWVRQLDDWTVIGLNSLVIDSLPEAADEQLSWLDEVLSQALGKVVLVSHEPLWPQSDQTDDWHWAYPPRPGRELLWQRLQGGDVRLALAGHTHRFHRWEGAGTEFVTAPSLSGPIPAHEELTSVAGDSAIGWLEINLEPAGHQIIRQLL